VAGSYWGYVQHRNCWHCTTPSVFLCLGVERTTRLSFCVMVSAFLQGAWE
jgi:hypothetical protein